MLVYHLINEEYGMEDVIRRRLKIATLEELNDPFELFSIDLSNASLRHTFKKLKHEHKTTYGLLCFSRSWHNPVLWSHYADKRRGLCLGFEILDGKLSPVSYSRKRLVKETETLIENQQLDFETLTKFLFTKYAHWRYENEVRYLINLKDVKPEKKLYFEDFSENLRLVGVIIGALSKVTKPEVNDALGNLSSGVRAFKARLAFKSFQVVRQKDPKL